MTEFKNNKDGSITIETTEEENRTWHEQYYAKKEQQRKDFESKTKPEVMKVLKDLEITKAYVNYSGSGDDGSINEVEFYVGDKEINLENPKYSDFYKVDRGERTYWCYTEHKRKTTTEPMDLKDYIEDVTYDFLEAYHGGWEINEGQHGGIYFKVSENVIHHDYVEIIENEREEKI